MENGYLLFITGPGDRDLVGIKTDWEGYKLTSKDTSTLWKGEELELRTQKNEITCGHGEITAMTKDGMDLIEFVPDFTAVLPTEFEKCQIIILPNGTKFQNMWGTQDLAENAEKMKNIPHSAGFSFPFDILAKLLNGETVSFPFRGEKYKVGLGEADGKPVLLNADE